MADQILALLGIALVPVSCVLTALWVTARRRAKRAEAMVQQVAIALAARGAPDSPALRQAVDTMALELDRIAEGQRFLTTLLDERALRDVRSATPPSTVTPH